jgi:hypothetical protein
VGSRSTSESAKRASPSPAGVSVNSRPIQRGGTVKARIAAVGKHREVADDEDDLL